MSCDQFSEDWELYALGSLDSAAASAMTEHLASGCSTCQAELRRALEQNEMISRAVPLVAPPARLRRRMQESFAPPGRALRRWQFWPWALAVAALLALAAGLVLQNRWRQTEQQEFARVSSMLEILGSPGTREVRFSDPKLHALHGSLYIHQKLGMALVVNDLPAAPAGWKYESWLVPKSGAPQPVEPFQPDRAGRALTVASGPIEVSSLAAMAVSLEPQNSHPTKPTKVVFAAGT
jgi:anti-sigma-K factor RskA